MSHFTVAVFHHPDQSIDELLAPYDEGLKVDRYVEFTRQQAIDYVRKNNARMADKSDDECWQFFTEGYDRDMVDEEGNLYTTYNPASKWDWWTIGGRWSGLLKMKDGTTADSARIADIDFSPRKAQYKACLRFWDVVVDHQPAGPDENYFSIYTEDYFRQYYVDRETYARHMTQFSTYAVVLPTGEWVQKGQMGWWGVSSETPDEAKAWEDNYMERFIEGQDPELVLTVVDCHI